MELYCFFQIPYLLTLSHKQRNMTQTEVKVIERTDSAKFESDLNFYLSEGWQILSCSCGFVQSEKYDFCSDFKAVMVKYKIS
jgi:hypothetical protein